MNEFAYDDFAVQYVSYYVTRTPFQMNSEQFLLKEKGYCKMLRI